MSGRYKRRDVELILYGVVFGIVAQTLYEISSSAVTEVFPYVPPTWVKVIAMFAVVVVFWILIKRLRQPPEK